MSVLPVMYKQQRENENGRRHAHVQDLYPPATLLKPPNSLQVGTMNANLKSMETVTPSSPHVPPPLAQMPQQQDSATVSTAANEPSKSLSPGIPSKSDRLNTHVVQAMDGPSEEAAESRASNARCVDAGSPPAVEEKQQRRESATRRRKKQAKMTPQNDADDLSKGDKIELKIPPSDDISNWLQLDASESNECGKEPQLLQRSCDQPCDQLHDQQPVTGGNEAGNRIKTVHHSTLIEANKLVTQKRTSLQTSLRDTQEQNTSSGQVMSSS